MYPLVLASVLLFGCSQSPRSRVRGHFPILKAVPTLLDTWLSEVCQSSFTKLQCHVDNIHFDSDKSTSSLHTRPFSALYASIKSALGSQWLEVETDKLLPSRPPRHDCNCQHPHMHAVEEEQHFLFDCPLDTAVREQHNFCLHMTQVAFASFWSKMLTIYQCLLLLATSTFAIMPRRLISHIWLPISDCNSHWLIISSV